MSQCGSSPIQRSRPSSHTPWGGELAVELLGLIDFDALGQRAPKRFLEGIDDSGLLEDSSEFPLPLVFPPATEGRAPRPCGLQGLISR
jgi:hypothetical protein